MWHERISLPELKRLEPLYAKASDGLARDAQVPRRLLESTFSRMAQRFGGIGQTASRLAALAAKRSAEAVDDRLKAAIKASVGIDISPVLTQSGPILDAMNAATRANVELITSIPEQYFGKLQDAIEERMSSGVRFEDLAKEIERIGDVTESRAKLIARDQTSKMNGAFNQARQTRWASTVTSGRPPVTSASALNMMPMTARFSGGTALQQQDTLGTT